MKPIIRIQGLGKRYRIGERGSYGNLRESIMNSLTGSMRVLRSLGRIFEGSDSEDLYIWALRDITLDIIPGEVLGIIGRNGAGKSTFLKILSRITEPTTGRADLYGRVSSLLEVGTGFHWDLTGRENIYLSAAILGMKRAEIARKFDEIVAFAEVEKFIDTPVKRYSSGMYLRLAFAVAAHLEPEILLVDEVLAVGDVSFQKKCIGKMGEVASHGRTVLFVSHNMASVESLCSSCLLLDHGRMEAQGSPPEVITRYLTTQLNNVSGHHSLVDHPGRRAGSFPIMTAVELSSDGEGSTGVIRMGAPLSVRMSFSAPEPLRPVFGVSFKTGQGSPIFNVSDRFARQLGLCKPLARGTVICRIDCLSLMPGTYFLDLWLGDPARDLDVVFDAISFEVIPSDLLGTGHLPPSSLGPVFCTASWAIQEGAL